MDGNGRWASRRGLSWIEGHAAGGIRPDDVTEQHIAAHPPYPDMPDPDLVVRTSGEQRISNFMLRRAAYSELLFTGVLWPDFGGEHPREAVEVSRSRQRRSGAV